MLRESVARSQMQIVSEPFEVCPALFHIADTLVRVYTEGFTKMPNWDD